MFVCLFTYECCLWMCVLLCVNVCVWKLVYASKFVYPSVCAYLNVACVYVCVNVYVCACRTVYARGTLHVDIGLSECNRGYRLRILGSLCIFFVILLFTNPIWVSSLVLHWTRVGLVSGNLVSFPLPLSRILSMVHGKVLSFLFPIECSPQLSHAPLWPDEHYEVLSGLFVD